MDVLSSCARAARKELGIKALNILKIYTHDPCHPLVGDEEYCWGDHRRRPNGNVVPECPVTILKP